MEEKIRVKVILGGPCISNPFRVKFNEFLLKNRRKTYQFQCICI